jgi:predicted enzyme related to lactoylglutathione lyase
MSNSSVSKVGMVIHPVEDLDETARFYREGLGLEEAFRDGDRFCAFSVGGVMVALAAGDERLTESAAVSYKVDDVAAMVAKLEAAGATTLRAPEEGPHEIRAVLRDPAGHPLIVYSGK